MSPKTLKDPRQKIVADLKAAAGKYEDYKARIGPTLQTCWRLTYEYVTVTTTLEASKNTSLKNASDRLSRLIKRAPACVVNWYYAGEYSNKNGLLATDHRVVDILRRRDGALTKAERLRALDIAKREPDAEKALHAVQTIIAKSSAAAIHDGESKAQRMMKREDLWTEKQMKLELMAMRTIMDRFYGVDTHVVVVDGQGESLLEV